TASCLTCLTVIIAVAESFIATKRQFAAAMCTFLKGSFCCEKTDLIVNTRTFVHQTQDIKTFERLKLQLTVSGEEQRSLFPRSGQ
uniref:Secreted protein n=1 Tax=Haemonchus contortus TaxID=6289 RepID=A0A7I4YJN7_HAECO